MKHLYQDAGGSIHACEGNEVHPGIYLVWTKCERDVPANKSFKADEAVTCEKCLGRAAPSPATPEAEGPRDIKRLVDRFLGWKLPENFNPDAGISFKKTFNDHFPVTMKHEPTGTNLFDASQAEAMLRYVLELDK